MVIQVIAPKGHFQMRAGLTYVVIRSCPILHRVLLVTFVEEHKKVRKAKKVKKGEAVKKGEKGEEGKEAKERAGTRTVKAAKRRAELAILDRDHYEQGLVAAKPGEEPAIKMVSKPSSLPSWLHTLEGVNFELDARWKVPSDKTGHSPYDAASRRLLVITSAVRKVSEILLADNPDKALNAKAADCGENTTRFRLWFWVYLAFGQSVWALLAPHMIGADWDRQAPERAGSRFGRPAEHRDKEMCAARVDGPMVDKMVAAFKEHCKGLTKITQMWSAVVRLGFGGEVIEKPGERLLASHPAGEPLPSYDQFYYHLRNRLGKDVFRRALWNEQTIDETEGAFEGSMAGDLANVGERYYYDATSLVGRPKSYLGNYHLKPLYAVHLMDGVTDRRMGVGFSIGSEQARAYRYALFSAAIPKPVFGRIVGVPISDTEWSGSGLPAEIFNDRGPGASQELRAATDEWIASREMSRSYGPIHNASERSHEKHKKKRGAPEHRLSNLTVIEMVKAEVGKVITSNRTARVGDRMPEPAIVEKLAYSPEDMYQWLMDRHRLSLVHPSFEDAVRAFLDPIEFKVDKGKIRWMGRWYHSKQVVDSGLGKHIRNLSGVPFKGYAMQLICRYAWIEFDGQLIEVEAQGIDVEASASMPGVMEIIAPQRSKASGRGQGLGKLYSMLGDQKTAAVLGKEGSSGRTVRGKPKVTQAAIDEVKRLREMS